MIIQYITHIIPYLIPPFTTTNYRAIVAIGPFLGKILAKGVVMTRQYEPAVVAPIPPAVIEIAGENPKIVINWRLDELPEYEKNLFRKDPHWKYVVGPCHGLMVSPMLTDFFLDVCEGARLAILSQDSFGSLSMQIGTLSGIRPVIRGTEIGYGVNVELLLRERKHLHPQNGGVTLASSILAIAPVPFDTRLAVCNDRDGTVFASKFP